MSLDILEGVMSQITSNNNIANGLDDDSRDVLREIYNRSIARGADVMEGSKLSPEKFHKAVAVLVGNSLVSTTGSVRDAHAAIRSFFSIRPSVAGTVRSLIGQ
jgi:hypothetical protein